MLIRNLMGLMPWIMILLTVLCVLSLAALTIYLIIDIG